MDAVLKFKSVQCMSIMPLKRDNGNYSPSKLFVEISLTRDTTDSMLEDIKRCCEEVNAESVNCVTFVKQTWKFKSLCGDDVPCTSSLGCFAIRKDCKYGKNETNNTSASISATNQILPGNKLVASKNNLRITDKNKEEPTGEERELRKRRDELRLREELFHTASANNDLVHINKSDNVDPCDHSMQVQEQSNGFNSPHDSRQVQEQCNAYRCFISCGHMKKNKYIYLFPYIHNEIECETIFEYTGEIEEDIFDAWQKDGIECIAAADKKLIIKEDFCIGKISNDMNCANRIVYNDEEMVAKLHFISEDFEEHMLKCKTVCKRGQRTFYSVSKLYSISILCPYIDGRIISVKMHPDKDSLPFASFGDSGSVAVDKESGGVIGMIIGKFIQVTEQGDVELVAVRKLPENFLSMYDVLEN